MRNRRRENRMAKVATRKIGVLKISAGNFAGAYHGVIAWGFAAIDFDRTTKCRSLELGPLKARAF